MAASSAASVEQYLNELPPERREVVSIVRETILRNLPPGHVETMNWGMICYEVPLERYPRTYNGKPLMMAAIAAQKNHYALYVTSTYMRPGGEEELRERWKQAGYKLDMGKSCIRFKRVEDLPLEEVGREIGAADVESFLSQYQASRGR